MKLILRLEEGQLDYILDILEVDKDRLFFLRQRLYSDS
jgi:hypothetical protein